MQIISDLHIHSRFSRGCSTDLTIKNLEKYARIKGIGLLGTGDFTHPKWSQEIKSELKEDTTSGTRGNSGIYETINNETINKTVNNETVNGFKFILSTELSLMYSQGGKGRKIHNIILAPDIETAEQITEQLKKHGRVDYDGRPIFGISCIQFVEEMMNISKDIEIIPAHAWTPWFSLFGSNSGFDSIKECFGEKTKYIHSFETGLSSNPPMNWRQSQLDGLSILSFSDSHSYWPWRIGREATIFDFGDENNKENGKKEKEEKIQNNLTYPNIIKAIRTGENLWGTIEVDPNYGKYHLDGHRKCNVCMTPKESIACKNICPVCKKPLTIGVLHRVEELADRPEGFKPKNAKEFKSLLPLSEIISMITGKGMTTKKVFEEYYKLQKIFGSEYNILLNAEEKEIEAVSGQKIAEAIIKNRNAELKIEPGYDGEYGKAILGTVIASETDTPTINTPIPLKKSTKKPLNSPKSSQKSVSPQKSLAEF